MFSFAELAGHQVVTGSEHICLFMCLHLTPAKSPSGSPPPSHYLPQPLSPKCFLPTGEETLQAEIRGAAAEFHLDQPAQVTRHRLWILFILVIQETESCWTKPEGGRNTGFRETTGWSYVSRLTDTTISTSALHHVLQTTQRYNIERDVWPFFAQMKLLWEDKCLRSHGHGESRSDGLLNNANRHDKNGALKSAFDKHELGSHQKIAFDTEGFPLVYCFSLFCRWPTAGPSLCSESSV